MVFARAASVYNARLLSEIDDWSPIEPKTQRKWLLLSGASDPPRSIVTSNRKPRDAPHAKGGKFLTGVSMDLANMEKAVGFNLHNSIKDLELTKSKAFRRIEKFFQLCTDNGFKPMLYYTGHGETRTGDWCFSDGTISMEAIFDKLPCGDVYPTIISDACYSGRWADFCFKKGIAGFDCLSACDTGETAFDTGRRPWIYILFNVGGGGGCRVDGKQDKN